MSEPIADPRPSRQQLVVPPARGSATRLVAGAVACAALGFGLVWGLGLGTRRSVATDEAPGAVADRDDAGRPAPDPGEHAGTEPARASAPDLLPPPDDALPLPPPTSDRWSRRGESEATADTTVPSDDGPRAVSLDMPEPPSASAPRRFARFPVAEPAVDAAVTTAAEVVEPGAAPVPDALPAVSEAPADLMPPSPAEEAGGAQGTPAPEPSRPLASAAEPAVRADPPLPEDVGDLAAEPAPEPPPPGSPPAAAAFAAAPSPFAAGSPPFPPPRAAPPPEAFAPSAPLPVAAAAAVPLPTPPEPPPSAPPPAFAAPPVPAPPFGAAPPMMPPSPRSAAPEAAPPAGVVGQGRPGPMQLEGVQTPQMSVEKRGPREISVGKPARYEIVVRNVGSATAHDVILRDAVPEGTALVTTTPPASPVSQASGDAAGALVWPLGTLPPGGQAVVTMEVMPQVEGEIGSVASVSFRADASVRSRATKPDLAIECRQPEPVLIGRDMQITVTVTNPGTGIATGVVLEGYLPDNVSHRSGSELEFDVGQLRPGESRTIDLVLGTRGPGVHAARFAARADGGIDVKHQVPLEVTAPTLEVAVDMPLRRFLQRPATCTISMVNAGTAPARAIELAAQLPPGVKFVKANNAGWHDDRTHRVLWSLEELPAGETGTVQVVVMPIELGPQKIVVAARSADGLSAQAGHTCDVEGLAALSFEVLDSEDPIEVDGVTEYVVRVTNQGTKPATGVRLSAALLGDLEPLEAAGPAGHRFENLTVSFEPLAKLAPAEEAVFRIRAKGRRPGDQRIQVQLTSADQPAPITKEEITRVYADR